ncbi:hypothetical protein CH373_06480 [Leptospira perolatii]|uniref:Uncharacterized protein n=1 Tax=Leptospira perolatii TaxID=2023191 RepID=A0A2M9ZP78_9LEPT|nr:hypothetical protein [Leptospira perolatii]PJZ70906.1 hypothetical protein CH360_05210 [Leptospira perolatii]PJZ73801.1 hypothetical protein CH373_06480 [Leptospira perolatii]
MDYEKEKRKLLSAKSPEQYIEFSIKSRLEGPKKSSITTEWLHKSGYTIDDIKYARNRHPFWRKKRNQGSYERNSRRLEFHNYYKSDRKIVWDETKLSKFYDLNQEGQADHELARTFRTSIPAVNHIRRKFRFATNLLELDKKKPNKMSVIKLSHNSESVLKRLIREKSKK